MMENGFLVQHEGQRVSLGKQTRYFNNKTCMSSSVLEHVYKCLIDCMVLNAIVMTQHLLSWYMIRLDVILVRQPCHLEENFGHFGFSSIIV